MAKQVDATDKDKLRAGNQEAVRQWFERYADSLYTLVYHRLSGDADTAQDVVQQTFMTALSRIEDYNPRRGGMFVWLSYLSRNCTKKALREKNRHVPYPAADPQLYGKLLDACTLIAAEPLPQDVIEQAETTNLVRVAMGSISADYASVLRQYYYEELSADQISQSGGRSTGAVRVLLHRAREAFKEALLGLVKEEGAMDKG
jgi:RNA polymerase sigma-70 factor (ECF subfamily)